MFRKGENPLREAPLRVLWAHWPADENLMTQTPPEKMKTEEVLRVELETLKREHRDLDEAIDALQATGGDTLTVRRLKKQKLALKDKIAALEDRITPDIIA